MRTLFTSLLLPPPQPFVKQTSAPNRATIADQRFSIEAPTTHGHCLRVALGVWTVCKVSRKSKTKTVDIEHRTFEANNQESPIRASTRSRLALLGLLLVSLLFGLHLQGLS